MPARVGVHWIAMRVCWMTSGRPRCLGGGSRAWELAWLSSEVDFEAEASEYVHRPVLRWIHGSVGETTGARMYNRTAAATAETRLGATGGPKASYNDGTVTWVDGESDPQTTALLMVHEAAHEVGPSHVPCMQDPDVQCDASWKGAYGKELAAASWGAEVADNEQRRALYPELRDTYRRHINAD